MEGDIAQRAASRERFAALDLLRGVAALCVLVDHLPWAPAGANPFPRGHLAVDLFFVLSGFVIAHAYEYRLGSAALFKQFYIARIIRLYPLYLLATLAVTAELLVFSLFGKQDLASAPRIATSFATGMLMLPTPSRWSVDPTDIFPLVTTGWSLFWEELVNFAYASLLVHLRGASILIPALIGAAALCVAGAHYGTIDLGWQPDKFWPGAARSGFAFFFGIALFRFRKRFPAPRVWALPLPIILVLTFIPSFGGALYELACVLLVFPMLVWLGAEAKMAPWLRDLGLFLGYISYPVYLVQVPVLIALAVAARWTQAVLPPASLAWLAVQVFATIAVSWLAAILFDTPVRERLRRRFVPGAPQPAAQTAP